MSSFLPAYVCCLRRHNFSAFGHSLNLTNANKDGCNDKVEIFSFIPRATFNRCLSQSGKCKKDSLGIQSSEGLISGKHKQGFFSLPLTVTNGFRARLPGWEKKTPVPICPFTQKRSDKVGLSMTHTVGITSVHCESAFINGTNYAQSQTPKVRNTKPVSCVYSKESSVHWQLAVSLALQTGLNQF